MRLTVIPSDDTMIMNGRALVFPFVSAANLHAIQWHGTFGFIETTDGKQVRTERVSDVQPFIDAFIARAAVVDAPPPQKPLPQIKAEKLKQLEAARKSAIATLPHVTVAGKQFPADSEYQMVISNLSRRLAAARPLPASVRGVDGAAVTLNAALLNSLDDTLSAAVQAQWDKYWLRFEAVQAATTNAAVEAVAW